MNSVNGLIEKRLTEVERPTCINQFLADIEVRRQTALVEANTATPRTTKLSSLQKQILTIASRWRGKDRSDVYTNDIKAEAFGWQPLSHYSNEWVNEGDAAPGTARYAQDHHCASESIRGQTFDRQSVGERHYNAVSVSVSRALKRLMERHLLYQSGAGWSLTEHGLEVVKTCARASTRLIVELDDQKDHRHVRQDF